MVICKTTKTSAISFASILFLTVLIVPSVYADESIVDVVTINVPVSCSMSASGTDSHTANVNNGQTTENIGTTNLKVICNDNSGYAIYAIGYTDDTYGKTVLTSSALGSTHDIATATTVTTGTSSWAMKLASVSGTYAPIIAGSTGDSLKQTGDPDFSDYTAVPEEYTKVAYYTSSTDTGTNATGSNLTTTYRAYISPSQPAGTYIGQVKYTLVHPNMIDNSNKPVAPLAATDCPANSICYAPNSADIVGAMISTTSAPTITSISSSDKAGKQTQTDNNPIVNITSNSDVQLIAPNFSRPGYGFAGWSTDFEATNSSTIYGPNETITVGDVSTNGMILYPVWIASTGNLQGTNGQGWTGCSSLTAATYNSTTGKVEATLSSVTALKDTRDNNVYAVARLADGKCWMIENLRLNAENTRGDANAAKAQGYGDATANDQGKFIGLADSENANFTAASDASDTDPTTANSIYYAGTQSGTATIDIFQTDYASFRMPRYNNNNTNRNLTASYNGAGGSTYYQWYGYGNYYSWPAAIANTKEYIRYFGANGSDDAGTSICPKGWKLPLGFTSTGDIDQGESDTANRAGSFSYLNRKLGGTGASYQSGNAGQTQSKKWRSFPNNFVFSGGFSDSSASNRGSYGIYWSSSVDSRYYTSTLVLYREISLSLNQRFDGKSVRCIAQ